MPSTVLVANTGRQPAARRRAACAPPSRSRRALRPRHGAALGHRRPPRPAPRPVRRRRAEHRARPHRRRHGVPGDRQGAAAPPGAPQRHPHRLPPGQPGRGDHGLACRCASRARPPRCSSGGGLVDPAVDTIEVDHHAAQHPRRVRRRHHRHGAWTPSSASPTSRCRTASPPIGDPEMPRRHGADDARRAGRDRGRRRRGRRGAGRGGRPRATAPRPRPPRATTPRSDPRPPSERAARPRSTGWSSGWATPGKEFAGTRHNVGAEVVAELAAPPRRHAQGRPRQRPRRRGRRIGDRRVSCWPSR